MDIKQSSTYRAYNRSSSSVNPPGRPVGVIVVGPNVIYLTVSPFRNDLNTVIDQISDYKNARLPKYELSLFNSCFRNW